MIYYINKFFRLVLTVFFVKKHRFTSGLYVVNQIQEKPQAIYLDHVDTDRMHLGDLLFFAQIVSTAIQSNIDVYLVGSTQLKSFFSVIGVKYLPSFNLATKNGLILTKDDAIYSFRHFGQHVIMGFNFWKLKGEKPVANLLNDVFTQFCSHYYKDLLLEHPIITFQEQFNRYYSKKSVSIGDKLVVNSFVESQQIFSMFRQRSLARYVSEYKLNHEIDIVCVGAMSDKSKKTLYHIDVDLRGELSIDEFIHYLINENIRRIITFDTFVAHIATILGIKTTVFCKSSHRIAKIKNRFVPFYEDSNINHINII